MKSTLITQIPNRATPNSVDQLTEACAAAVEKQERIGRKRRTANSRRVRRKVGRYVYDLKAGLIEWELSKSWKSKIAVSESLYAGLREHQGVLRRATRTLLSLPLHSDQDVYIDSDDGDWLPEAAACGHRFLLCVLLSGQNSYDTFEPELCPQQYINVLDSHKEFHSTSRLQFLRNGLRTLRKHKQISGSQLAMIDHLLSAPQADLEVEIQRAREVMTALR